MDLNLSSSSSSMPTFVKASKVVKPAAVSLSMSMATSAFVVFSALGALWSPAQAQGTVVLTAQAAANTSNGYWRDAGGAFARDSSGACVRAGYFTNDMTNPDCGAKPAAPAPAPVVQAPVPVPPPAPGSAYWKDANGTIVRSGSGECVRAGFFSKELATVDCDPSLAPKPAAAAPAPAPVVAPAPAAAAPAPAVAPARIPEVVPAPRTVTFRADAFFDFDKSAVKPEGQAALRSMINQARGVTIEQVRIEGHTDATGPAKYNIGLAVRRAETVKKFLVQEGIPADKVVAEGVGEAQPVASNATRDGRALNRRVEVEIVGSRIAK